MYIWLEGLTPVMTIIRMGRGLMMGVDHNKNMEWVGASASACSRLNGPVAATSNCWRPLPPAQFPDDLVSPDAIH